MSEKKHYTVDEMTAIANEALDSLDADEFSKVVGDLTGRKFKWVGRDGLSKQDQWVEEDKVVCEHANTPTCPNPECEHAILHYIGSHYSTCDSDCSSLDNKKIPARCIPIKG
jgi:hypothetical protein